MGVPDAGVGRQFRGSLRSSKDAASCAPTLANAGISKIDPYIISVIKFFKIRVDVYFFCSGAEPVFFFYVPGFF